MSFTISLTEKYQQRETKFLKRHSELKSAYAKALKLHRLSENLSDLHAISINLSYRITLESLITETEIILVNIGDHQDVY
ncbi:MAG: plasmid stabilization protein [Methylococcales bacterium]|nr:plasmid stabilization protein [Methylococcales bacterium]MDD5755171.1 plasmid stabilization protein [Methylococcales bacterium]